MSERFRNFWRAAIVVGVAALAAGCVSRPVGDFGRAAPSVAHDRAMPAAGNWLARQRREPVANFNQTDQEREMHDRVWRFLVAPHAKDWSFDSAVELQRTRISGATDLKFMTDRYYRWLKKTEYQSSPVRYATVGRHIAADLDTLPATFAAICAVREIDRQRAIARDGLSGLEPQVVQDVAARHDENETHIAWFARALDYRYQSYGYALDHLLVETPHDRSLAVDEALRRMAGFVARSQRSDFCGGAGTGAGAAAPVIPSRYATRRYDTEIVAPK